MPKTIKELREMSAQLEITVQRLSDAGGAVEFHLGEDCKLIGKAILSHRGELAGAAPSDDEIYPIFTRYDISPEATKKAIAEHPLDMQAAFPAAAIEGDDGLAAAIEASKAEYDAQNVRQVVAGLSDIDAAIQASLLDPSGAEVAASMKNAGSYEEDVMARVIAASNAAFAKEQELGITKESADLETAINVSRVIHETSQIAARGEVNLQSVINESRQSWIKSIYQTIDQLSAVLNGGAAGGGDVGLLQEKLFIASVQLDVNDPEEQVALVTVNSILYP